jgi:hypothetical protein
MIGIPSSRTKSLAACTSVESDNRQDRLPDYLPGFVWVVKGIRSARSAVLSQGRETLSGQAETRECICMDSTYR